MARGPKRAPVALSCLTCGATYPLSARHFAGCPEDAARGISSNLAVVPDDSSITKEFVQEVFLSARTAPASLGIWRFRGLLPVLAPPEPITLGEGFTPLVHCKSLGRALGYGNLYLKNEAQNPTGSFKDRLASAVVNHGIATGERVFVWSSSGNAGTSSAAYAARAGAVSIGFMSTSAPVGMSVPPAAFGAKVILTPDRSFRQAFMSSMVSMGAYPTTNFASVAGVPVGSNPFGTEGYRTIAYEIFMDLGRAPDVLVSPTCYGDQILGIARGFDDLRRWGMISAMPQMIAALPPEKAQVCISTGRFSTAQTTVAVSMSKGKILDTPGDDHDVLRMQRMLAEHEGVFLEPSSAAALLSLETGDIPKDATVVIIGTAGGLKDARAALAWLAAAPVAEGEHALKKALLESYGLELDKLFNSR